ncbi:MAG: ABC transporter permease [Desulforudis sp.]|jgi:peptide/nickel transport system permease protein|nr:MAG: ABC transporter permease [Desulforudis sp.]
MFNNSNRTILLALCLITVFFLVIPWCSKYDPLVISMTERLLPPSQIHWLGTDDLGRDLLSRVLHGIALTLTVSVVALLSSLFIGALLGALAGYYYSRWPDRLFCWIADFLTSLPFLLVVAAILSVVGPGLVKAYAVLTAIMWTNPARIVRAEVIRTLLLDYVVAERAMGAPEWKILFVTVLPTCVDSAVLFSVGYLPEIVALEAGLSFLGLGVQPPQPSLGKMIYDSVTYIGTASWVALSPATALFLIVLIIQGVAWAVGTRRSQVSLYQWKN